VDGVTLLLALTSGGEPATVAEVRQALANG
jgi:hypothetical protein